MYKHNKTNKLPFLDTIFTDILKKLMIV